MKHLLIIVLIAAGITVGAYGIGHFGADDRQRTEQGTESATEWSATKFQGESIHTLRIGSAFRVTLRQGEQTGVRLSIDSRLKPYLVCELHNGRLRLGMENLPQALCNGDRWVVPQTAEITVRSLVGLDVSGAVRVEASGRFTTDRFELDASGATEVRGLNLEVSGPVEIDCSGASQLSDMRLGSPIEVEIDASGATKLRALSCDTRSLEIELSGAAQLDMTGTTAQLDIEASGASQARLGGMKSRRTDCSTSGAARIECSASDEVKASASGASHIVCSGGPKVLKQEASRASSIRIQK